MTLKEPFESTDDFYDREPEVKYKLRHFGKFRILAIVAGVLALLTLLFIVLYAVEKSQAKTAIKTSSGRQICGSRNCLFTAYDMVQQVNQTADPCEDFYEYACGGWIEKNPLKEGETSITGFSTVSEKNYAVLKKAIESSWKTYSKNEAVMKTARFYNSCINTAEVEAVGDAPLKAFIRELGGWYISGNVSQKNLMSRIARINQVVHKKPLFNVQVEVNPQRSDTHVVMFKKAAVGMLKDYYVKDTDNNLKVRKAYQKYMKDVASLLSGSNSTKTDAMMMQVYEFEAALSQLETSVYSVYSVEELMQRDVASGIIEQDLTISIKQFANVSGTSVGAVVGFLNQVFSLQKFTFNEDSRILVYPPKYFMNLFSLYINQTLKDPKVLDNYVMWTVIHQFILALPSKYYNAYQGYRSSLVGNDTDHRWKKCLMNMQSALKMPLGLLFVDQAFKSESRTTLKEMTGYVRESFLKNIEEYTWMDEQTKENARQKALAIKEDIGYPDYIKDSVKLANEIKSLKFGSQLFQNARNMMQFIVQNNLGELKKPVNKDKWLLGPSQTNGYYSPAQNRIVFLAGILQPPFYNPLYPNYLNYGGIGMVIGHEITHGFDGLGKSFDKDGNFKNWWSTHSNQNFEERASCLVKQYNKFSLFGVNINGTNTLNENIADNGGIKIAYSGYKSWMKAHGAESVLPGLGLTVDQLFFVGFARPWCSIYTKKPALNQIKQDSHSNSKFRVIGTLQNFPRFAEAFNCKPNSYMNPEKKCSVW